MNAYPDWNIHDYMVTRYLMKAMERDRTDVQTFKLGKVWNFWMDGLIHKVEQQHIQVKKNLRAAGCKIVLEEVMDNRMIHVMYVHRGYEHHCYMMPTVLKGKCEERLRSLLSTQTAGFPGESQHSTTSNNTARSTS
ncbi:hypothetical protein [Marinicrinis sediminis]|uniref:Uncharacterized protein n=1 Tax=Marinicrinis sediminis TaxID=1652465 RepID=A0ABW5R6Q8_9BACL